MERSDGLLRSDAMCRLSFAVDVWEKGKKVDSLSFNTMVEDFTLGNKNELMRTVLHQSLQTLMLDAVPEVMTVVEH
jgi:hypothetical protein